MDKTQRISAEPVAFTGNRGEVSATLYLPSESIGISTGLVFATSSEEETRSLALLPRTLAEHGAVTLAIDFASPSWDGDEEDIVAALDFLDAHDEVDSDRLGVAGFGRGGTSVMRTAAADRRVKAVMSLNAPYLLEQWVKGAGDFSEVIYRDLVHMIGADPIDEPELYRRLSPLLCAQEIDCPVLIVHGTEDLFVPPEQAFWMYIALGHTGNRCVRLELPFFSLHYFDHAYTGSFLRHAAHLAVDWVTTHIESPRFGARGVGVVS